MPKPKPLPSGDVVRIITDLQLKIDKLTEELDTTKKWGEAGWKRWGIVADAIEESNKIEQEL